MATDRSPGEWNQAVRQQAAVAEIGLLGLRTGDLDDVLREAMVIVAGTLDAHDLALFELQPDRSGLLGRVGFHRGQVVSRQRMAQIDLPVGRGSLPGYTVDEGAAVVSADLLADERFTALAAQHGVDVQAALAAPISWDEDPWGVFVVYSGTPRAWTDDEVHFVQSTANTMGLAIQRAGIERELRDSSTRLDLSLSAGGLGAWSWDLKGDRLFLNASALAMYGLTDGSFTGRGLDFVAVIHPDDRSRFPEALDGVGAANPAVEQHNVFRIIRPDTGELRWIEVWGRPLQTGSPDLHLVGVCSDVTERRLADEQQAASLQREHEARIAAEQARERLAFLAEASAVLSTSLDPSITLLSLGELCVPSLADICFIDLIGDDGFLHDQVGLGSTEVRLHDAQLLRKRRRELGNNAPTSSGHLEALGGKGLLYHSIDDAQLVAAAADHLALFRRFDARSTIMAPLVARGRVIGVITLVRCGDQQLFDDDDLAMIEELAARAALATDNGRLFDSRNRVARSLQEALLPPAMPVIEGLALAARYDVAEADVAIGGDFYDVMLVSPGEWGVVVGDVCGRGPDAAALTGLVRHTLRTAVVREQVPSRVLGQTNQAMLQQLDDGNFCTAAYLRVQLDQPAPGRVRITAASAGHPRPVLVRADGRAELLDCAGTLLGVVANPSLHDVHAELGPGDAVVLYTDGVTEARQGDDLFGESRVVQVLASLAGQPAEAIASGLEAEVAAFRRTSSDDTAILVLQVVAPA